MASAPETERQQGEAAVLFGIGIAASVVGGTLLFGFAPVLLVGGVFCVIAGVGLMQAATRRDDGPERPGRRG